MNGIICVDKPSGFTSFDVIAKMRGILKFRKLGHAGTLDPMATGVLPVFAGAATKVCDILPDTDKAYEAGFKLGIETDTLDITGNVTKKENNFHISEAEIKEALKCFSGDIMQIPPMFSAVTVDGVRLYKLARKGIVVEREPRPVSVYDISLLCYDGVSEGKIAVSCSKGTYIRTIIGDLGEKLGVSACLTSLVRTKACGFSLEDCITLENLEKSAKDGTEHFVIPTDTIFRQLPEINLNEPQTRMYKNGIKLDPGRLIFNKSETNKYRIYDFNKNFIGTAVITDDGLRVDKNLG